MLNLNEVRLTPYDASTEIPKGFKIAGEFKTRRGPSPMQYNWYSRHDSVQHEVFHKLAIALTTNPQGYTVDELKAPYTDEADKAKVDEIINKFKGSWDHRHTGFDLVADEATGTRFMLVWRDPRTNYAKEIGLTEDFSQTPHQKIPTYVTKVPELIEEAKNPKPVVEKAAKAPKDPAAPKAPKASKSKVTEITSAAPAGGYLLAFASIAATLEGHQGNTIGLILDSAITQYVDPNAMQTTEPPPDDVTVTVAAGLRASIDKGGLEGPEFVDRIAKYQKATSIKAGFYKVCKDLAKKYADHVKAQPAPAAQDPVAAAATQ